MHLLRSCLSLCKINHLVRTVPKSLVTDELLLFDEGLRSALSDILKTSISDLAWKQAVLPLRLGGLGLREASSTAAAYTASVNVSRVISNSISPVEYSLFPGEAGSADELLNQLSNIPLVPDLASHSQKSLQSILDVSAWNNLLTGQDLYGRARLSSLASSKDTSGWLKAPPIQNLGLSMPSLEVKQKFASVTK